jgi:hypothetical protein
MSNYKSEQQTLTLTVASEFGFGFDQISPIAKEKGTIIDDFIRGDFGDDDLAMQCKAELERLRKNKNDNNKQATYDSQRKLIDAFIVKRWGVKLSPEVLTLCDQKLWQTIVDRFMDVPVKYPYYMDPKSKRYSFGKLDGSDYVVVTIGDFRKIGNKHPNNPIGKIPGELQLVYRIEKGSLNPVGCRTTRNITTEIGKLQRAIQPEQKEKSAEKPVVLNLTVQSPDSRNLFSRAGVFCSKLAQFIFNRIKKPKAVLKPNIIAPSLAPDSEVKPNKNTYSGILSSENSEKKAAPVTIRTSTQVAHVKPVQKQSFIESIFGCFKRTPVQPSRQSIALDKQAEDKPALTTSSSFTAGSN